MLLLNTFRRPLGAAMLASKPLARTFSAAPAIRSPILRQAFRRPASPKVQFQSKRFFTTEPAVMARPPRAEAMQRLAYAGALFGGTLIAANLLFNRETRENAIPAFEKEYLHETFTYTGVGVAMIGLAAKGLHNAGWSYRLMTANPWMVLGLGLVASVGTMLGTRMTDPDNYIQKHVLWTAFNLSQAALLAPMYFYNPAILARAGLYTVGVIGSIAFVAATAKEDKYLYLGGPLLAGVAVVALSGLAPMVLPLGSRALVGAEALWLMAQMGLIKKDTVNESISLELDFINIFVRMVQILANRQSNNGKR
ncbi:uncharacterized protein H6S33_005371 [Morchella sextelata]|uniref:uncharacterized protein n=1 Tax=Morchella sextelata TaxID=1174677 RepID=UPI001D03AD45|nr:uncharacterized protein H6S33_005371 [Morchella sextelata]KAH0613485.1 hypothetical protein H6S33_005371 [Morchella sextelata]